jgi:hypothetical protein
LRDKLRAQTFFDLCPSKSPPEQASGGPLSTPELRSGDQLWQDWTRTSGTVIEGYGNHVGNWIINSRRARISAMLGLRIHHRRRHSAQTCIEMIQLQVLDKHFRISLLTRQTSRL